MGLFNSGKNDKTDKVDKYDAPPPQPRQRSSKHHSNRPKTIFRAMPQPSLMPMGTNYFQPPGVFSPSVFGGFGGNVIPQVKYGYPFVNPSNSPYDLSKYGVTSPIVGNPYGGQMAPMNLPPGWPNGMGTFNNRSAFQRQPFNDYQQSGWPVVPPSNYGYMAPMQF